MIKKCHECGQSCDPDPKLVSCPVCLAHVDYWCEKHSSGKTGYLPGPTCPVCITETKTAAAKPPKRKPPAPSPTPVSPAPHAAAVFTPTTPVRPPAATAPALPRPVLEPTRPEEPSKGRKGKVIGCGTFLVLLLFIQQFSGQQPLPVTLPLPPMAASQEPTPPQSRGLKEAPQPLPDLPSEENQEERLGALLEQVEFSISNKRLEDAKRLCELLRSSAPERVTQFDVRIGELTKSVEEESRRDRVTELTEWLRYDIARLQFKTAKERLQSLYGLDPPMAQVLASELQKATRVAIERKRIAPADAMVKQASLELAGGKWDDAGKIFQELSDRYPQAWKRPWKGRSRLYLLSAKRIPEVKVAIFGMMTPDPYVIVRQGDRVVFLSKQLSLNPNPVWNENTVVNLGGPETVVLELRDRRKTREDLTIIRSEFPNSLQPGFLYIRQGDCVINLALIPEETLWAPGVFSVKKKRR